MSVNETNEEISIEDKRKAIEKYTEESIENNLLALNFFEIKDKYPKAIKILTNYVKEKSKLPVDDEELLVGILLYSARTILFEFFDSNGLFINILGADIKWYYAIERVSQSSKNFESRVKCEKEAFLYAFAQLEN